MRKLLTACLIVCTLSGVVSAATLWTETFETDGQGSRYTSTAEFSDNDEDYYGRLSNTNTDRSYTSGEGSFWWGGQDQNDTGAGDGILVRTIIFSNINVSSYTDLVFKGLFAEERPEAGGLDDIDSTDYVHVEYQLDGGGWQNLLWFENDGGGNTTFLVDTNFDGTGEGTQLETAFADFSANIAGTGNSLDLRVIGRVDSGDEDWAMDNLRVEASISPNSSPVLAVIGNQSLTVSNALNFAVTASDADSDPVVLSASNLPPGAVFNTVTNTGSVTGQFNWASAEPVGVYTTTFYAADGTTNDFETITITVSNAPVAPPLTGAFWNVVYNLPQQSGSSYPDQFLIRDALVERINALQSNNSAILATFTFSANDGAGFIINAMDSALNRGADISFIADGDINVGTDYGGTNSLLDLSARTNNPLTLVVDGSSSGIMHDKLGLFDYGGTNQWVFTASWNFTLSASADQWNIALEARSPSLYSIYTNETAELLAGRFHDDPAKSHAHDGSIFTLDGSWGTNFVRFAPYPDDTQGGNNAERDITNLIAQAQSEIVFALNKLNREPIRDALVDAADRGVIIKGVMPRSDTDPGGVSDDIYSYLTNSANYATTNIVQMLPAYAKADYSELDDGEQNLIHAKTMVIDPDGTNAIVIHGSANWTSEALVNDNDNDENTVFLRHNEIAAEFHEHFQRITGTGLFNGGNSTIVEWDFNDADRIADGGLPANETQTVARVPAPGSYSFTDGNKLSANGWNGGAGTKYWEASFSTLQHTNVKVSSRQTSTSTGPAHFQLQYKIGSGGTYADVTNGTLTADTGWNAQLTRLPLPAACDNQPEVFLRWLMTSNTAVNGSSVGFSGANRIDDILVVGTAFDLPPVVDPIDDQTVFEGELLSFTVTASDPVDGDPITITATNLPSGATFDGTNFVWNNAAPIGAYDVTFTATDKDGSDDEVVTITVLEKPLLLISEIADPADDGGDAYRFVELYNAGTNTIDLGADGWVLSKQINGGNWSDIALTGTIAPAATWVIANGAADFQAAYGFAPDQESSSVSGNGDDAYFLYYDGDHADGILIDIYGELDTNGTDTDWEYEDSRAVRNNDILVPNNVWTVSEWTIYSGATTNNMTPGQHGPRPTFDPPLENLFVIPGDSLSQTVTAVNTVRTDTIALSAINLPSGATFPVVIGTNSVSSTLNWNNPTVGIYTITYAAAGLAGTHKEPVIITVSSNAQIVGRFYGWDPDTIIKLNNGQFWENVGGVGANISPALSNPDVTITKDGNSYLMYVDDDFDDSRVVPIEVTESMVTNLFTGLRRDNIYQLEDGTIWEQAGAPTISSSAGPVTTWRWMDGDLQRMRFFDQNGDVIGTCRVEPAAGPANPPIISEVDGYFRGWKKDRVFMLANGQFWQQIDLSLSSEARSRPDVIITYQSGDWYMSVDGAAPPAQVQVRQLFGVTRTRIDGIFQGFGLRNIFPLTNGEWWRQTSLENTASTHSSPEVLLWSDDGDDFFEMPDLGQTVEAEELAVYLVSTITNDFTGLRRGNIYQLANDENWMQASGEIINTPADTPQAMLWAEDGLTNLLVRGKQDVTIGTCRVVDPEADTDGDMMSNAAEAVAGTDLFDAESTFKVTETTRNGTGHYVLHWDAVEGRVYTVGWTPSLTEYFQPLETTILWPQNSWTDTVHSVETKGFYRIGVRLAD